MLVPLTPEVAGDRMVLVQEEGESREDFIAAAAQAILDVAQAAGERDPS
jgi:hypothetical protein